LGIVNMLRFNDHSGAMICDEETTYFERRRTHFDKNIRNLLTPEISDKLGIEAYYGGAGYPPFHYSVIRKAVSSIRKWAEDRTDGTFREVAGITLDCMRDEIRRRVNDKLRLYFGFDMDELNQGFYMKGDRKIEIKQECVRKKAREISDYTDKSEPVKNIFSNDAAVVGYDSIDGFQAYNLRGTATVLSFLTGFETIGPGKYGAIIAFAKSFNRKFIVERRAGYDRVDGMILLLTSAVEARRFFIDVGGYFNIVYINGKGSCHKERVLELASHRTKLAEEVVFANIRGMLDRKDTENLIRQLIFEDIPIDEAEEKLFDGADDPDILEYILRGYKIDPKNLRTLEREMIRVDMTDMKGKRLSRNSDPIPEKGNDLAGGDQ